MKYDYLRVTDELRDQIATHYLPPGSLLASEAELCGRYNLSRPSIRKALALLEERGLIRRLPGKGRVINEMAEPEPVRKLSIGMAPLWLEAHYSQPITEGAQAACRDGGGQLCYCSFEEFMADRQQSFDGYLIIGYSDLDPYRGREAEVAACDVRLAVLNRITAIENLSYFAVDYELEAARAIHFLRCLGGKTFAFIHCAAIHSYIDAVRMRGYRRGIAECGVESLDCQTGVPAAMGLDIRDFLIRHPEVDSLFVPLYPALKYVLWACQQSGRVVGRDIAVFCFDFVPCDDEESQSVTFAEMPLYQMAYTAVKHLLDCRRAGEKIPTVQKLYPVRFVISSSQIQEE